jgi:molybdenum-dependent DNA-binding transcriptional regulator ModE
MLVWDCRYAVCAYPGLVLTLLRAFLVALEEGSLNRAAIRLRMSQSALSRQMQALENEVGGALLERTTTGVRPTDAGHALAISLPRVLADYDTAMAEARRLARGQRDLIRVGYLGSAAQMFLDPALFALRHTHPEVKVKLLDLSPGEQTWDFLVVWQRGRTATSVRALLDALSATVEHVCEIMSRTT